MEQEFFSLEKLGFSTYEISKTGVVRNIRSGYILKESISNGYIRKQLKNDGNFYKNITIHVLVAKMFLEIPIVKNMTVDHIDRNKTNNDITNLRWATRSEQNKNRYLYSRAGRSVIQIKNSVIIKIWNSVTEAANSIDRNEANVLHACINGGLCGGYNWDYYNKPINNEIWIELNEFDKSLSVSSKGRIKTFMGKIYKGTIQTGYYSTTVYINEKKCCKRVHRLMAQAFLGQSELQVNHKNGNKLDNRLINLEYMTNQQNCQHAVDTGLRKSINPGRKVKQIYPNSGVYAIFDNLTLASRETKISKGNICSVCRGNRKTAGGYEWKYA